ncbi:uncharacterized protein LOC125629568 [Caretta caretta]|uniref:uncharacterized protein LOC125629568 n=1 Tax=Caretta caretta TaxID=8467 RepID=UPI003F4B1349
MILLSVYIALCMLKAPAKHKGELEGLRAGGNRLGAERASEMPITESAQGTVGVTQALSAMEAATARFFAQHWIKTPATNICGDTAVSVLIVQKMAEESAERSECLNAARTSGRKEKRYFSLKCIKDKQIPITVTVVITALIITIIALAAKKTPPCPRCPPHVTAACPDGWVGYQGNCYHFSETEGNWSTSQSHCSSLNASLASIDSLTELVRKRHPHTASRCRFPVRGEGQCAYLNEHGVSSSRCYSERPFICKQPDECSRRKPSAAGGDTMAKITYRANAASSVDAELTHSSSLGEHPTSPAIAPSRSLLKSSPHNARLH